MKALSKKILIVFTFALCLAYIPAFAQDKAAKIDELVRKYQEYGQFNGSILVAENGRVIYKKGHGYANMEWKIPNEPDTKFRIGSVTKQFTAALILQLVEQGKIKLDATIPDYLPYYRKDTGSRVTIHHLLNHTSGIPSYTGQPGFFRDVSRNSFKPEEFVKKYSSGDLEFEPGSKFVYNNSAYFILGAIIETVTGKPYEQVVRENIFEPLGMKNSGYDNSGVLLEKRASGYSKSPAGYVNAAYLDMSIPYAAGSLYSTVEDLYLWDQAMYGDKIISAKSKELMFKPGLEKYGYGVFMDELKLSDKTTAVATIEHNGGINGFNSDFIRMVEDKHLIVILDNVGLGRFQRPLTIGIANILHGQSYDMPKRSSGEFMTAAIAKVGLADAIKQYRDLKAQKAAEYNFSESELNDVGYQLMRTGKLKDAIEIFKLNVETHPTESNPYDSLGEAYAEAGDKDLALKNYRKALELNPKSTSAAAAIKRLESPAVSLDDKQLDAFVGRYELRPNFVLTITKQNGGLFGQATGQPGFDLVPSSPTRFFVKQIGAEIEFKTDADNKATGLVLHQGGREMPGKRLPE